MIQFVRVIGKEQSQINYTILAGDQWSNSRKGNIFLCLVEVTFHWFNHQTPDEWNVIFMPLESDMLFFLTTSYILGTQNTIQEIGTWRTHQKCMESYTAWRKVKILCVCMKYRNTVDAKQISSENP